MSSLQFNIWQMKDAPELREFHFEPIDNRGDRPIHSGDYDKVYSAGLHGAFIESEDDAMDVLERLFEIFNLERPDNFKGHSMSVSDIVEFPEKQSAYFCDRFGWKKIENFHKKPIDKPIEENYFTSSLQGKILEEIRSAGDGEEVSIDGPVLITKKGTRKVTVHLATGDLTLIVAMLRDYVAGMDEIKQNDIQYKAYYRGKFLQICENISSQIDYNYDEAVERCRKKYAKENTKADKDDIGEEAMSLMVKRGRAAAEKAAKIKDEEAAKAEGKGAPRAPQETLSQYLGRKLLPPR